MRISLLLWLLVATATAQSLQTVPNRTVGDRRSYLRCVRTLSNTTLNVDWKEASLDDALKQLRVVTGLNLILNRKARELAEEPLGFQLKGVRGLALINLVEERLGVVFLHQRGVLRVTTRQDALRRSLVLSIQDVRDLLYVPPDFPGPDIGVRVGPPTEPEPPEPTEQKDPEEVIELVRKATGGDEAWELDGVSITAASGKLVIKHTVQKQREVRRFLAKLRGAL